ncbi:MAG: hypothetical protein WCL54_06560, partial [Clostridia bacterium]
MRGKNAFKFWSVIIATALLVVFALTGLNIGKNSSSQIIKGFKDVRTGIDITGGVTALLQPADGEVIIPDDLKKNLDSIKASIEVRLDGQGILDKNIFPDYTNGRIIVEIPWKQGDATKDANKLIEDSIVVAKLYFQEVKPASAVLPIETTAPTTKPGAKNTPKPTTKPKTSPAPTPTVYTIKSEGGSYQKVNNKILLEGDDISTASSVFSTSEGWHVQLEFSPKGQQKFFSATTEVSKNKTLLGIFMDETLISAPTVEAPINGTSAIIKGKFTAEETTSLADKIRSGKLPFKLKVAQIEEINASQGQQAYTITIYALLLALILIMIFMLVYYRLPGLFAG